MSIKINIHPYFLRDRTNNWSTGEVCGNTVGQCLNYLVKKLPAIEKEIFDEDGKLRYTTLILVNGEGALTGQLVKPVKDGDELHIVYARSGCC